MRERFSHFSKLVRAKYTTIRTKIKKYLRSFADEEQSRDYLKVRKPSTSNKSIKDVSKQTSQPKRPIFSRNLVDARLHEFTKPRMWKWESFRGVLICLATLGEGNFVPATRRPDGIFLDGLLSTFEDLRELSHYRNGRETSKVILVDRERACLVISGKTHIGSLEKVKIDTTPEPGREEIQQPVLSIHVHPNQGDDVGLSNIDYVSFLSDQRQIIMIICYQGGLLFAMKTSSTPKAINPDIIKRMIETSRNDVYAIWSNFRIPNAILAFNKAVCLEFGMTLYKTSSYNENFARRIEVTN